MLIPRSGSVKKTIIIVFSQLLLQMHSFETVSYKRA